MRDEDVIGPSDGPYCTALTRMTQHRVMSSNMTRDAHKQADRRSASVDRAARVILCVYACVDVVGLELGIGGS